MRAEYNYFIFVFDIKYIDAYKTWVHYTFNTTNMKHTLIILLILNSLFFFSQETTIADVYKTNKVYYYGYDFTHFKLVEPKRIEEGKAIKNAIYEWIGYWNEKLTENNYRKF